MEASIYTLKGSLICCDILYLLLNNLFDCLLKAASPKRLYFSLYITLLIYSLDLFQNQMKIKSYLFALHYYQSIEKRFIHRLLLIVHSL